jgi:hypothetical protein
MHLPRGLRPGYLPLFGGTAVPLTAIAQQQEKNRPDKGAEAGNS